MCIARLSERCVEVRSTYKKKMALETLAFVVWRKFPLLGVDQSQSDAD
jgi:hypothetical protein